MKAEILQSESEMAAEVTAAVITEVDRYVEEAGDDIFPMYTDLKTPQRAREALATFGFSESDWDRILAGTKCSHQVRATIVIARADHPMPPALVHGKLRELDY